MWSPGVSSLQTAKRQRLTSLCFSILPHPDFFLILTSTVLFHSPPSSKCGRPKHVRTKRRNSFISIHSILLHLVFSFILTPTVPFSSTPPTPRIVVFDLPSPRGPDGRPLLRQSRPLRRQPLGGVPPAGRFFTRPSSSIGYTLWSPSN